MNKVIQFWKDTLVKFYLETTDSDNPPMYAEIEEEIGRFLEHFLFDYELQKAEETLNKLQEICLQTRRQS